jgi:predicted amidohydrolase
MKFLLLAIFLINTSILHAQHEEEPVKPIEETWFPVGNFPESEFLKVAVLQWSPPGVAPLESRSAAEAYMNNNRLILEKYIRAAAKEGAKLILTPEFGVVGYPDIPELPSADDNFQTREQIALYVEDKNGKTIKFFSKISKELKVTIHVGFAYKDGSTYYNAVAALGPDGSLLALHKKMNLYQREGNYISPGEAPTIYESSIGKVGILICSDVYDYYTVLGFYQRQKVNLLALSTSWAEMNTGWKHFVDAAKYVKAPIAASNHDYFPDSGVVFPNGKVHSHIRQSNGLAYGFLPIIK